MRLCLTCRFVSPDGALLCGRCGRSFDGRLCPRHHLSPAGSQFCVQCGRQDLTEATLHLPLGWLSRVCAWGFVFLCLSTITHHAGSLVGIFWDMICWGLIHLLNISPCWLLREGIRAVTWLIALLVVSYILPSPLGSHFRTSLIHALRWGSRTAVGIALMTSHWVFYRVEGAPKNDGKKSKKKSGSPH